MYVYWISIYFLVSTVLFFDNIAQLIKVVLIETPNSFHGLLDKAEAGRLMMD